MRCAPISAPISHSSFVCIVRFDCTFHTGNMHSVSSTTYIQKNVVQIVGSASLFPLENRDFRRLELDAPPVLRNKLMVQRTHVGLYDQ